MDRTSEFRSPRSKAAKGGGSSVAEDIDENSSAVIPQSSSSSFTGDEKAISKSLIDVPSHNYSQEGGSMNRQLGAATDFCSEFFYPFVDTKGGLHGENGTALTSELQSSDQSEANNDQNEFNNDHEFQVRRMKCLFLKRREAAVTAATNGWMPNLVRKYLNYEDFSKHRSVQNKIYDHVPPTQSTKTRGKGNLEPPSSPWPAALFVLTLMFIGSSISFGFFMKQNITNRYC
eukprot:Selendium_serpulae@DN6088_c0_g2_i1.p1